MARFIIGRDLHALGNQHPAFALLVDVLARWGGNNFNATVTGAGAALDGMIAVLNADMGMGLATNPVERDLAWARLLQAARKVGGYGMEELTYMSPARSLARLVVRLERQANDRNTSCYLLSVHITRNSSPRVIDGFEATYADNNGGQIAGFVAYQELCTNLADESAVRDIIPNESTRIARVVPVAGVGPDKLAGYVASACRVDRQALKVATGSVEVAYSLLDLPQPAHAVSGHAEGNEARVTRARITDHSIANLVRYP